MDKISPEYLTPITVWYGKQGVSALGNANLMDNNNFGAKYIYSSGLGRKSFILTNYSTRDKFPCKGLLRLKDMNLNVLNHVSQFFI